MQSAADSSLSLSLSGSTGPQLRPDTWQLSLMMMSLQMIDDITFPVSSRISSQWSGWSWITRPLFMIGLSVLLTHVLTAQKLAKYWLGQAGRTPAPALGPAEARAAVQRSSLRMRDIHLALRGSEQSEARVSLVTTQLWQGGSPTRGCRPPRLIIMVLRLALSIMSISTPNPIC